MDVHTYGNLSLPEEAVALEGREVHVWHLRAWEMLSRLGRFMSWLSPQEAARADRFRFGKDRGTYVIARGALRDILARYLGARPDRVELELAVQGKPRLAGRDACSGLAFNTSHSGDVLLVAIARGRKIGVDVEAVRSGFDWESVARFALPRGTVDHLIRQSAGRRLEQFYGAWTAVEALAKAAGCGLAGAAQDSERCMPWPIVPRPAEPAVGNWGRSGWWLYSLELPRGYCGSLVVEADWAQPSGAPKAPRLTTRAYTGEERRRD